MYFDKLPDSKRNIIKAMSKDPLFFLRTVAPNIFRDPFGPVHRAVLYDLPYTLGNPNRVWRDITLIEMPRGFAKSMVFTVGWSLWQVVFKGKHHIPITSVDEATSQNFLDTLAFIVASDTFRFYFGDCVGETWNKSVRVIRNDSLGILAKIASYGVCQSVVGLTFFGYRPDVWIIDDIENPDTVKSTKSVEDREAWIFTVVMPALQSDTCPIVFIGTPYAVDCVITRLEDEKYKRIVRLAKYPALVETEAQSKKLGVPIGNSIWEDKFPTKKLIEDRERKAEAGMLNSWNLAYRLKASFAKVKGFDPESIKEIDYDEMQGKDLAFYILTDFAYSNKSTADPAAIVVVAIDTGFKNRIYVIENEEGQWGDVVAIQKIAEKIKKYIPIATSDEKNLTIGIESNSWKMLKKFIYDELYAVDMRRVSVIELCPKGRTKIKRMQALIPYADTGRLFLHKSATALKSQMLKFDGLTDKGLNSLDACSYMLDLLFQREDQETPDGLRHKAWLEIEEAIDGMCEIEEGDYVGLTGSVDEECF